MAEFMKLLVEFLKLTPAPLLALAFVAGILLFASQKVLESLSLFDITQRYRPEIAIGMLLAGALGFAGLIAKAVSIAQRRIEKANRKKERDERVETRRAQQARIKEQQEQEAARAKDAKLQEYKEELLNRLDTLTEAEKKILRPYVQEEARTLAFDSGDGDVQELTDQGFLKQAPHPKTIGGELRYSYTINEGIWSYLKNHPEKLAPKKKSR